MTAGEVIEEDGDGAAHFSLVVIDLIIEVVSGEVDAYFV